MDKIRLTDKQRQRIRWSNGKKGYVPVLEFVPLAGRRGSRPIEPLLSGLFVTETDAARETARVREAYLAGRIGVRSGNGYRIPAVRRALVAVVDQLGNVLEEREVTAEVAA